MLLPVCGRIADIYGRRQIFYWTTLATGTAFFLFFMDASLQASGGLGGNGLIYMTAPLLASFATHGPVGWAMAMDLVPDVSPAAICPYCVPVTVCSD